MQLLIFWATMKKAIEAICTDDIPGMLLCGKVLTCEQNCKLLQKGCLKMPAGIGTQTILKKHPATIVASARNVFHMQTCLQHSKHIYHNLMQNVGEKALESMGTELWGVLKTLTLVLKNCNKIKHLTMALGQQYNANAI